jgi:hypothetical protein
LPVIFFLSKFSRRSFHSSRLPVDLAESQPDNASLPKELVGSTISALRKLKRFGTAVPGAGGTVWRGLAEPGGICVSARVQEDATGRLDLAFEDLGEQALKNIARPVRAYRVVTGARLTIAVLSFANMSGDPEQDVLRTAWVEEIITALSRIRWLFVIARNSTFTYKGQAVDVKQVGRELGVGAPSLQAHSARWLVGERRIGAGPGPGR